VNVDIATEAIAQKITAGNSLAALRRQNERIASDLDSDVLMSL